MNFYFSIVVSKLLSGISIYEILIFKEVFHENTFMTFFDKFLKILI